MACNFLGSLIPGFNRSMGNELQQCIEVLLPEFISNQNTTSMKHCRRRLEQQMHLQEHALDEPVVRLQVEQQIMQGISHKDMAEGVRTAWR